MAAMAKNHATPVDVALRATDDELKDFTEWFLAGMLTGAIGASTHKPMQGEPMTPEEVLACVAERSPAQAKKYAIAYEASFDRTTHDRIDSSGPVDAVAIVKKEILKAPADSETQQRLPRLVHSFDSAFIVYFHTFAMPAEAWLKNAPFAWKGLPVRLKWVPIANMAEALEYRCGIICLDCKSRDANTVPHDFYCFTRLMLAAGWLVEGSLPHKLLQRGIIKLRHKAGVARSTCRRLWSGVSYTSIMNFFTTCKMIKYLAWTLELPDHAFAAACEGDDSAVAVAESHWDLVRDFVTSDQLSVTFAKLGKDVKLECAAALVPRTAFPVVGGFAVYMGYGEWSFIPSWDRAVIKAGFASIDEPSYANIAGRIKARADALNDRFDEVPVFWAYARVVAEYAATFNVTPEYTNEELFELKEHGWTGRLAQAPSDLQRDAFSVVTGIDHAAQVVIEEELHACAVSRDYTRDLTYLFSVFKPAS
jgi:hypothetical protein